MNFRSAGRKILLPSDRALLPCFWSLCKNKQLLAAASCYHRPCLHANKYPGFESYLVFDRIWDMTFTQNIQSVFIHGPVYVIITVSRFLIGCLQLFLTISIALDKVFNSRQQSLQVHNMTLKNLTITRIPVVSISSTLGHWANKHISQNVKLFLSGEMKLRGKGGDNTNQQGGTRLAKNVAQVLFFT